MDIASLGFKIDTSDVAKADSALDGLAATGAKTEAAAQGVGKAWTDAGRRTGAASAQLGSTASAVKQGNVALKAQQVELGKLLGQINPVVSALGRLDEQEAKLRKFKAGGVVDADTFRDYKAQIDASRASLGGVDGAIRRTGITSKQSAQALRQLPAQFSDIAISLQAGQSPLSVFLQQGAQIKDSFGGVGAALRETGKYALGLVNPFTVGAAAVAILALAYKQGSDEATAFKTALILSGNAAGTTSGQLSDMARAIDGTVGTQRQAAAALAEVAGSGKFTAEQLQAVATAAVAMEVATGKAVSDTVSEFKKLADEPAAAAAKLNDQYNFLTASVYAQITALEDQGDAAGAASLAIETFGDAMERRANQIEGNLGLIESAWAGIKNVATEAWDEMLGIGREQSIEDRLVELRSDRARESFGPRGDRVAPSLSSSRAAEFDDEELRLLIAQQSQGLGAATEGLRAENQKTAIQGLELIGKEAESAQSSVEKLRERLGDLDKAKDFNIANRSFTPEAQAQFDKSTAALNKQIADAEERANRPEKTPRTAAFREDAGARMLNNLREQYAQLIAQGEATKNLTSSQRELVKFQQQIADIKNKQVLTADQKSLLASQDMITAQLNRNVALDAEIQQREKIAKVEAAAARQQALNNHSAQSVIDSLMTEEEAIKASYDRRRDLILKSTETTAEEQNEALLRLQEQRDEDLIKATGSYWEKWLEAAGGSLTAFDDLAGSVVENFSSQFGNAFESMVFDAETLDEAVTGMAENMARSVVNAIGQMAAQWLAYQAVQLLVGKSTQASAATALAANASAMAVTAGLNAFASTAAIPIVGPFAAPAAAAAALAITVPMASAVGALALAGMAHDGIDSVPKEGTWLLDKGERVVDRRTNQDLKRFLMPGGAGSGSAPDQSNRSITVHVAMPEGGGASKQSGAHFGRQVARAIKASGRYA